MRKAVASQPAMLGREGHTEKTTREKDEKKVGGGDGEHLQATTH
jgi:hypothetical protein